MHVGILRRWKDAGQASVGVENATMLERLQRPERGWQATTVRPRLAHRVQVKRTSTARKRDSEGLDDHQHDDQRDGDRRDLVHASAAACRSAARLPRRELLAIADHPAVIAGRGRRRARTWHGTSPGSQAPDRQGEREAEHPDQDHRRGDDDLAQLALALDPGLRPRPSPAPLPDDRRRSAAA